MRVAIAGGHGKVARRLGRRLSARGDSVVGLIRNPDQADDLRRDGVAPIVCDLERLGEPEIAEAIEGADAVVFAAGAGPGSGAERKLTMDRDGAIKLLHASADTGVPRYLMISSVGAERPHHGQDAFSVYLRAKAEADAAIQESDRAWTIVRPGRLTDDPGSGRVQIQLDDPIRGEVPRDDVAAVFEALLADDRAAGKLLYLVGGFVPVSEALEMVLG